MYVLYIYYIKININKSIIMMFKEKSSKKKYNSDNNEVFTLDAMHNNIIKKFELTNKDKEIYKILFQLA